LLVISTALIIIGGFLLFGRRRSKQ
jgi:hypothetical protein